jgi:hypothetical protein
MKKTNFKFNQFLKLHDIMYKLYGYVVFSLGAIIMLTCLVNIIGGVKFTGTILVFCLISMAANALIFMIVEHLFRKSYK